MLPPWHPRTKIITLLPWHEACDYVMRITALIVIMLDWRLVFAHEPVLHRLFLKWTETHDILSPLVVAHRMSVDNKSCVANLEEMPIFLRCALGILWPTPAKMFLFPASQVDNRQECMRLCAQRCKKLSTTVSMAKFCCGCASTEFFACFWISSRRRRLFVNTTNVLFFMLFLRL